MPLFDSSRRRSLKVADTKLQVLGCVHRVPAEVPTAVASNSGLYTYTSKDFRMLSEKVDRVEEQLKESQQQTAALIEKVVGGIHSTIQSALDVARSATSISTPVQNSDVKRKPKTDETTPVVEKHRIDPNSRNYYGD